MTPRWKLFDTWEPGALPICVGDAVHDNTSIRVYPRTPAMHWAKLQWRECEVVERTADGSQIIKGNTEWQDIPLE